MGDARRLIEQNLEAWNRHDRGAWARDISDDCDVAGPGGLRGPGKDLRDLFFAMWTDAFPDNHITAVAIADGGEDGSMEAIFEGTHTGPLRAPAGEIPPTNRRVSVPFVATHKIRGGQFRSFHLYFDQVELLSQLGLMPAPAKTA